MKLTIIIIAVLFQQYGQRGTPLGDFIILSVMFWSFCLLGYFVGGAFVCLGFLFVLWFCLFLSVFKPFVKYYIHTSLAHAGSGRQTGCKNPLVLKAS